jgi:hypothetical protein
MPVSPREVTPQRQLFSELSDENESNRKEKHSPNDSERETIF